MDGVHQLLDCRNDIHSVAEVAMKLFISQVTLIVIAWLMLALAVSAGISIHEWLVAIGRSL